MLCRVNDVVKIPFANPRAYVSLRGDLSACSQNISDGTVTFHKPGRIEVTVQSGGDMWQGEIVAEGVAAPVEQPVKQPTEQPTVVAEVSEEKAEEAKEPEHAAETPAPRPSGMGRLNGTRR